MATWKAVLLGSVLIAISVILSGGLYEINSPANSTIHRVNKITGHVDFIRYSDGVTHSYD